MLKISVYVQFELLYPTFITVLSRTILAWSIVAKVRSPLVSSQLMCTNYACSSCLLAALKDQSIPRGFNFAGKSAAWCSFHCMESGGKRLGERLGISTCVFWKRSRFLIIMVPRSRGSAPLSGGYESLHVLLWASVDGPLLLEACCQRKVLETKTRNCNMWTLTKCIVLLFGGISVPASPYDLLWVNAII